MTDGKIANRLVKKIASNVLKPSFSELGFSVDQIMVLNKKYESGKVFK